jgi:Glycosyltransferase
VTPATWYVVAGNSDYYWRVMAPARAIGAKVNAIPEDGWDKAISQPNDGDAFPWSLTEDGAEYPNHEGGSAVWALLDLSRAVHMRAMAAQGIRTVSEVDDNYLCDPRQNIFLRANGWDARRQVEHMKAVASADAMIVTTNALRDIYYKRLRKQFGKRLVPPIHVCGNHVFLEDWPERIERDGPVRVGWMGSTSHVWDVDLAWPALLHARNEGCETILMGYNPADPQELTISSDRAYAKLKQWEKAVSRYIPWQQMDGTTRMQLPFDIGLCPLLHNHYTMGKSDIKALEYTISGAAVVASASPVYTENWIHGETALLASSPQEMLDYTDLLIRNPKLRERLVEAAQQYVREERDLLKHANEWMEAVTGDSAVLQGVQSGDRQVAVGSPG